jgi:predicted dehydrogenase
MRNEVQKNPPIVVGIIGGGYGISTLLPAIASISDFSITSIATSRNSSSISDGKDLENKDILISSADEIIKDPHVDLVVIACPPSYQEKFAVAALENGKSIFCEKPGGLDLEATKRINATLHATGGHATIGYQFRYDPLIKWLCAKVAGGDLGKIQKVDISWETSGAAKTPSTSWRNDPEKGGGVLRDFASHVFDYMSVVDPLNFNFQIKETSILNHKIRSKILEVDIQEIDFEALFGTVQFNCRVSRKIANPLGHRITIQGEQGVGQVVHRNPFRLNDMSARFWEDLNDVGRDCTQELNLGAIDEDLKKYNLDLRQLAVRNLFVDFVYLLRGGDAPNLPSFDHGILNQMRVEEVGKVLFSL